MVNRRLIIGYKLVLADKQLMTKKKLYGESREISLFKTNLALSSWVLRAKFRKDVFLKIGDRTMPSELVEQISKDKRKSASDYVQVSRAIEELEIQGLVKCLNPKEKTGRFYTLTPKGKSLKKFLEN